MASAATFTSITQLPAPVAETVPEDALDGLAAQPAAVVEGSTLYVTKPVLSVVTLIVEVLDQGIELAVATADVVAAAAVKLTVA